MSIVTQKFVRKPMIVDAVEVTSENFAELAAWCQGEMVTEENGAQHIHVRVHNPKNPRQTKAYVGDWILYTERGYKVYTTKAFVASFDPVGEQSSQLAFEESPDEVVEPVMDQA